MSQSQIEKKHSRIRITYKEALHLLLSSESALDHPRSVVDELPAIISHWMQSPKQPALVLGKDVSDRWMRLLRNYLKIDPDSPVKMPSVDKKEPVRIDYSGIPLPPPKKTSFTFIDLFAGIGGFRTALQNLDGKCVFTSEWEPHAKETYFKNYGEVPFGDIKKFTEDNNGSAAEFPNAIPQHDILAAGFPCQSFSQAGKQLGFNEARGTLFFEILKIIRTSKPKAVLLENVKRLRTHDGGKTFGVIKSSLESLGYTVYAEVLKAFDYGLPQNRERIFIVAFKSPIEFSFPKKNQKKIYANVGGLLEDSVDDWYTISDKIYEGHTRRLREHRTKGNGFGFSIVRRDAEYTNTISARYWKDGSEILIDQGDINPRMLTPRECARLQGFSETFIPHTSRRHAYQQFGNSVPIPVVGYVAQEMLRALKENKKIDTQKL
jgi:DNA (cytosine-5)-methyltransferase 1